MSFDNLKIFIITFMLIPVIYYAPFYVDYKTIENQSLSCITKKDVVIIYDSFYNDNHGDVVTDIFTSVTKGDYELLKIDREDIRVESLRLIVLDLLKKDKRVFINSSVSPSKGIYSSIWKKVFKELADMEGVFISQSIGNQINTERLIRSFTHELLAKDIDSLLYSELNKHKDAIHEIAKNETIDYLISNFGAYGITISSFHNILFSDRNMKVHRLVEEVAIPILEEYNLMNHKEEIVEVYSNVLTDFSYSILLQSDNSKVLLVSSSTQFVDDSYGEYFLDCRVDLLKNKVRFPALSYLSNGEMVIGTSVSAPLALNAVYEGKLTIKQHY